VVILIPLRGIKPAPPQAGISPAFLGGRGTQRGICFSRNSTRRQIL